MTNCFNCINFQWKEISDDPTIRASTGVVSCLHCKAMTYCSESCRSEHWLKLHQFHCDIMRGAKVIPGGKHDKDYCLACKEESEAAGANNNGLPSLPCYLPNNFVPAPITQDSKEIPAYVFPVQLGEMTGVFESKLEQTLSIMLRLMKKMMIDNHPLWTLCRSEYMIIWNALKKGRELIWMVRQAYMDFFIEKVMVSWFNKSKLLERIIEINKVFERNGIKEVGPYKPYETLKILFGITRKAHGQLKKMDYENAGKVPKSPKELEDKIESVSQFHEMWSQVLQLLPGRLAHIEDLKKAACYGDITKPCWGCFKDFKVKEFYYRETIFNNGNADPVFMLGHFSNFSHCGKCNYKRALERFLNLEKEWNGIEKSQKLEICDFCGKYGEHRHRCITCHTKLYCGRECWEADQEVHKEFCKPCDEIEPWKVKDGFSVRKEARIKRNAETTKTNEKVLSKYQDMVNKM